MSHSLGDKTSLLDKIVCLFVFSSSSADCSFSSHVSSRIVFLALKSILSISVVALSRILIDVACGEIQIFIYLGIHLRYF